MFSAEDFYLTMEEELKLRVITDEIKECRDVSELQKQLTASTELMMKYQHILHRLLKEKIQENLNAFKAGLEPLDKG